MTGTTFFSRLSRSVRSRGLEGTCKAISIRILAPLRSRKAKRALESTSIKERFSRIYRDNLWNSPESRSGTGSEVRYTANIRSEIATLIRAYGITSVVDAPCGDFNWMRYVVQETGVSYIGVDIVDELISKNDAKWGREGVDFIAGDITKDPLPNCDLLIVRDCLFHLSYGDINLALRNLARCEYKWLLTTSHDASSVAENLDITTGGFRRIDLLRDPFCFSEGSIISRLDDSPPGQRADRWLLLFEKQSVPTQLAQKMNDE